jgi:predicted PurR-regulated permease PerM
MEPTTGSFKDEPSGTGGLQPPPRPLGHGDRLAALADDERGRHARIQSGSLAVLATGGLLTLMFVAKSILILILVSILIAFMLAPIVELCQRLRLPRSVGAMISVLLMCGALYAVFYVSYSQADQFISALPKYSGNIRGVLNQVRLRAERVRKSTQGVLPDEKPEKDTLTVRESPSWQDELTNGARGVTEIVLLVAFIPFLVFFMLSWQDHVRASTVMLFRVESRNTAFVTLGLIAQMIRGFIVGNFIIGIILGITSSIAFWVLGVPYFYVIGMISGIVSLLPYLGIVLAILPPVMVSLGTLTTQHFLGIVAVVAISHVIALNLLYPKIIGRRLRLNPLAVILALLFWGWLWGAMGLILAVPLTAAIKIILDHVDSLQAWGAWLGE